MNAHEVTFRTRLPWGIALVVWLLLCIGSGLLLRHWHRRERLAAADQAYSLVHALASTFRTMGARWSRSEEELQGILDEIVSTPAIDGIAITDLAGVVHVCSGIPDAVLAPARGRDRGAIVLGHGILAWDTVSVGPSVGGGRGRYGRWQQTDGWSLPEGGRGSANGRLFVRMSLAMLYSRWQRDLFAIVVFWGVGLVLVIGAAKLWSVWRHTLSYAAQLQVAAEEHRALEEMNLVAAGLAHEIKNPLGVVRGTAQALGEGDGAFSAAEASTACGVIVQEIDRVTSRVNELLAFARPRRPVLKPVSVVELCRDLMRLLGDELAAAGLVPQCPEVDVSVMADLEMLRQVVFNLLHNAIRFAPGSGDLTLTVAVGSDGQAFLGVRDRGPGIAADLGDRIFSPYVTTAADGGGTGLGLAIARRICRDHGWTLRGGNAVGGGAFFEIGGMVTATDTGVQGTMTEAEQDGKAG